MPLGPGIPANCRTTIKARRAIQRLGQKASAGGRARLQVAAPDNGREVRRAIQGLNREFSAGNIKLVSNPRGARAMRRAVEALRRSS